MYPPNTYSHPATNFGKQNPITSYASLPPQFPPLSLPPQFLPFSSPPLPNSLYLEYYSLVPLQQQSAIKNSPKMRIYDESDPNQFIEKNEDDIMKKFTNFLEKNPKEARKLSSSNVKVSYNISRQNESNELSLSFNFEPSDFPNQDSITFINAKNEKHKITKNIDIKKLEEKTQIILPVSNSESTKTSHIFTPQEVSMAIKEYVEMKGEIPTHNLIIITDENKQLSFKESHEEVKNGEYFVVKSEDGDTNLTIGNKTKEELTKIINKSKREAEDKANKEAEKAKREAEERVKREAEEKANKEAEKVKREAEEKANKEAEKVKREAEERVKREAEEKAKQEAEKAKLLRQLFNETSSKVSEIEKLLTKVMKNKMSKPVDAINQTDKKPMLDIIKNEIETIVDRARKNGSLLRHGLVESIDQSDQGGELDMFGCLRSPKENNFYEILTTNPEARSSLIDYLAEYDDEKKSKKLTSLVKLITEKNNTYEELQSPRADKAKIMEDLTIELGVRIFENHKELLSAQETNVRSLGDCDESNSEKKKGIAKEIQDELRAKLKKNQTKLEDFLERTGLTKEELSETKEGRNASSAHPSTSVSQVDQQETSQARSHG